MAVIRSAVPTDVDSIARAHVLSWQTTYRGLMPDAVLDNLSFESRGDWWRSVVDAGGTDVVVAEEAGEIIGFAYFGPERENDPVYRGELYAIYLLSEHQRKGLGRLLVRATAQGLLRLGVDSMIVWVLSTNPACGFYEKVGGIYLRDKPFEIGGAALQESAYGWEDIRPLAEMK